VPALLVSDAWRTGLSQGIAAELLGMPVHGEQPLVRVACAYVVHMQAPLIALPRVSTHLPPRVRSSSHQGPENRPAFVAYLFTPRVSLRQIRRAHAVTPISAVQLEWSLFTRDAEVCHGAMPGS
jgi:hypothetical protein